MSRRAPSCPAWYTAYGTPIKLALLAAVVAVCSIVQANLLGPGMSDAASYSASLLYLLSTLACACALILIAPALLGSTYVVSVCVPDAGHVDLAIADLAHGTARRDRPLTVMLHSTVHPDTVMSARRALAGAGGRLHDVCVAGGATAAREGQLVLFVGGRGEMADEAAYLLDHYGNHVVAAGPVGAGAAMKLAFNVQTYAQFAATATAFGMASSAAVDRDALAEAWRHVGQLGALTEQFLPILELGSGRLVGAARDRMQATVDIARKDLRLAAELCDDGVLEGLLEALGSAMPEVFGIGDGATDDGRGR